MRLVHHHSQPLVCYYKATLRREGKKGKNICETYQNRLSTIHMHTYYPRWRVSRTGCLFIVFLCVCVFLFSLSLSFLFFRYLSPITLFTAISYHTVETIRYTECSTVSMSSLALPFISIGLCFCCTYFHRICRFVSKFLWYLSPSHFVIILKMSK